MSGRLIWTLVPVVQSVPRVLMEMQDLQTRLAALDIVIRQVIFSGHKQRGLSRQGDPSALPDMHCLMSGEISRREAFWIYAVGCT